MAWFKRGDPAERNIRTIPGSGYVRGELPSNRIPNNFVQPEPPASRRGITFQEVLLRGALNTMLVAEAAKQAAIRYFRTTRRQRKSPFN